MTEWSKDLVLYRIDRAHDTLEDACILANAERWNVCYYACFYAVSALLLSNGLSSSKHSGVRSLLTGSMLKRVRCQKRLHGFTMIFLSDARRVTTLIS